MSVKRWTTRDITEADPDEAGWGEGWESIEWVRADEARAERDRAVETRENANAVSVRVELENTTLRRERDEARASAAQLAEALREALNTVPPAQNAPMDQWRAYFARMDAARDALAVFDAKEKT